MVINVERHVLGTLSSSRNDLLYLESHPSLKLFERKSEISLKISETPI